MRPDFAAPDGSPGSPGSSGSSGATATPATVADLAALRARFPVTARWTYLNHAAIGPLPAAAAERAAAVARGTAEGGDRRWPERNAGCERARELAARLLGAAEPSDVAFAENTSAALSLVAEGLPWEPGDNVVTAACEYPANIYPWMNLARRGVELRRVPERDGRVPPEDLLARVDGRTRVLALSWVQYATGFRSDLAALGAACRERGVLFMVDVIQGLGALALDVRSAGIDAAAGAAHKWLLGPEGVGLLYLSPRLRETLVPVRAGWRSVAHMFEWDRAELDWNRGALAWECGTLNALGINALAESLELLLEIGPAAVEARVLALAARLADGLAAAGFELASPRGEGEVSGIVSVHPGGVNAEAAAAHLARQGIVVAQRAGRLRLSPHVYNSEDEVDRAVAASKALKLQIG